MPLATSIPIALRTDRKPGDPIPKEIIRELRQRRGLSQDALAYALGLSSGKNVISSWETGRSVCDGPAAELVLRLLGVGAAKIAAEALSAEMENEWNRAGEAGSPRLWRGFMAVVDSDVELDRDKWLNVFPGLEIPSKECVHGFPFVDRALAPDVFGIGPGGWSGWINTDKKVPPSYGWVLKRDGRFAYRERAWEEDPRAVTNGHVLVGSLLELALAGTFFMGKVAKKWGFADEQKLLLRLDMKDMLGRGIVGQQDGRGWHVDQPAQPSSESHIMATMETTVERLVKQPVKEGLDLVAEFIMPLRPDLAQEPKLKVQLQRRLEFDRRQGMRRLGFVP